MLLAMGMTQLDPPQHHQYKSEVHGIDKKVDINLSESEGSEQNNFGIQNNLRYSIRAEPGKSTITNLKNSH